MEPKFSPWGGKVLKCKTITAGVYQVTTVGKETDEISGIMVEGDIAHVLFSPAALACGFLDERGYYFFEQNGAMNVAVYELTAKDLYPKSKNKLKKYGDNAKTLLMEEMRVKIQCDFPNYAFLQRVYEKPAKRFVSHYMYEASAILIDRQTSALAIYHVGYEETGVLGISNLHNPECIIVSNQMKKGLIQRTENYLHYKYYKSKNTDKFIYGYLMTQEQQSKCYCKPEKPYEVAIAESDDFSEMITAICEWAYYYYNDKKGKDKALSLQYCKDFLSENPSPPTENAEI